MKALSIRQPWAWLIVNGFKDFENRSWATKHRGEFLVHAAQGMTKKEYYEVRSFVFDLVRAGKAPVELANKFPHFEELKRGGIVGSANIGSCVMESSSPWFFGKYGYALRYQKVLPFTPCKGQLGFFEVSYEKSNS